MLKSENKLEWPKFRKPELWIKMSNIHHNMSPALDYSLEAKKLWEKLGNSTLI